MNRICCPTMCILLLASIGSAQDAVITNRTDVKATKLEVVLLPFPAIPIEYKISRPTYEELNKEARDRFKQKLQRDWRAWTESTDTYSAANYRASSPGSYIPSLGSSKSRKSLKALKQPKARKSTPIRSEFVGKKLGDVRVAGPDKPVLPIKAAFSVGVYRKFSDAQRAAKDRLTVAAIIKDRKLFEVVETAWQGDFGGNVKVTKGIEVVEWVPPTHDFPTKHALQKELSFANGEVRKESKAVGDLFVKVITGDTKAEAELLIALDKGFLLYESLLRDVIPTAMDDITPAIQGGVEDGSKDQFVIFESGNIHFLPFDIASNPRTVWLDEKGKIVKRPAPTRDPISATPHILLNAASLEAANNPLDQCETLVHEREHLRHKLRYLELLKEWQTSTAGELFEPWLERRVSVGDASEVDKAILLEEGKDNTEVLAYVEGFAATWHERSFSNGFDDTTKRLIGAVSSNWDSSDPSVRAFAESRLRKLYQGLMTQQDRDDFKDALSLRLANPTHTPTAFEQFLLEL